MKRENRGSLRVKILKAIFYAEGAMDIESHRILFTFRYDIYNQERGYLLE